MDTVTPSDLERVESKLDEILAVLNGNGKPGILTRLALIEDWQRREEAAKQVSAKDWKSVAYPLLTQMIGAGIALAVYIGAGHALGILH